MRKHDDFGEGKRGPVIKTSPGKTRITIRLDDDLLDWFRRQARAAGGGNYQTLINEALRDHVSARRERLEQTLRRVVREELAVQGRRPAKRRLRRPAPSARIGGTARGRT